MTPHPVQRSSALPPLQPGPPHAPQLRSGQPHAEGEGPSPRGSQDGVLHPGHQLIQPEPQEGRHGQDVGLRGCVPVRAAGTAHSAMTSSPGPQVTSLWTRTIHSRCGGLTRAPGPPRCGFHCTLQGYGAGVANLGTRWPPCGLHHPLQGPGEGAHPGTRSTLLWTSTMLSRRVFGRPRPRRADRTLAFCSSVSGWLTSLTWTIRS